MNQTAILIVFFLGSLVLTLFAFFMILYLALQKRRQYSFALEKQQLEHKYDSELLQSRIEVQEQALQNLSEELHDNIGQVLSLTKMQLHRIVEKTEDESIRKNAQQGTELLVQAISDLRSISHTANGGLILNIGLIESIKKEVSYISSVKNINCNFSIEGVPYPLTREKDLLVFRIIQESLANAIKHGSPDKIEIALEYKPGIFSARVTDNGAGFKADTINGSKGLGLHNMKVRADMLKGTLNVLSSKETGTTINLDMPVSYEGEK